VKPEWGASAIERALACVAQGWWVFPVVPRTKRPAVKEWQNVATLDAAEIDCWFNGEHADCDVGILTGPESGIWVLDIDRHGASNGAVVLQELVERNGGWDQPGLLGGFCVNTPSGGGQWYFAYPDLPAGWKVRNQASGALGPGLDVRGWHGQVIAPMGTGRPIVSDTAPMRAPGWLEDLVAVQDRARRAASAGVGAGVRVGSGVPLEQQAAALEQAVNQVVQRVAGLVKGSRNHELNQAAFRLGLLGLDETTAQGLLMIACEDNGLLQDDGERQCLQTIESGFMAGATARDSDRDSPDRTALESAPGA
jgi:hypothetical protein